MRYLVVRKQNAPTARQFKIVAPVITIGRTSENSIALKDGTISRQHCAIETSKGITRIRDLGSFHGFQINQKQAREAILRHGDCVTLGTYELYYVIKDDEPDPLAEGGVTQNRARPGAAPAAAGSGNGSSGGAGAGAVVDDSTRDAAGPMEGDLVEEQDFPEAVRHPGSSGAHEPVIDEHEDDEGSIFDIEMQSGDFPLPTSKKEKPQPELDDEFDLNAILKVPPVKPPKGKAPKARPTPAPPAPRPESRPAPPPPAPAPAPAPAKAKPDPKLLEAEARYQQLQHEFGELLKSSEATKIHLKKALEELEVEKLRAVTAIKKYNHLVGKAETQEKLLAEAVEKNKAYEAEAARHLKDYNELDERFSRAKAERTEFEQKVIQADTALKRAEDARTDAEQRVAELTKANEELTSDVQKLQAQFSAVRKKMATLETNLNTVQESRMRAKNVASTMERERDELRQQLETIAKERDVHQTRTIKLEQELSEALRDQSAAEGRIVEVQKSALGRDEKMRELEDQLAAARDTIADLEEEIESQREALGEKLSASAAKVTNLDEEKIKRKLGAMEKERRQAIAAAEATRKQLATAQQQSVVLQSFLDEREQLIKKLRDRLRQYETVDGDTKGE